MWAYRVRMATRVVLLLAFATVIPGLLLSNLVNQGELSHHRDLYDRTRADLEAANARLRQAEERLTRLTTSVHAVELEARERFRLVQPGETLILIEH